jgi:spore germination cell wall hydrolase CwlJ-like protein
MIANLVKLWGTTGGHRSTRWTLKAATWACLAGAVLTLNAAALAEPFDGSAAGKIDRFLRPQMQKMPQLGQLPQLGQIPMWTQVDPGKAEIFSRPTPAAPAGEIECLALNIYFEARGESETGQLAVGHVVMNRVNSKRFPSTVCDVVQQGGELRRHRCQFSWWCDGRSDTPRNKRLWEKSAELALNVYWGRSADPTEGALWYHADYVKPYWRKVFERGPKIGRHIFYSQAPRKTQVASRVRDN